MQFHKSHYVFSIQAPVILFCIPYLETPFSLFLMQNKVVRHVASFQKACSADWL